MSRITVTLDEDDIRAAVMSWAVTRILNEGRAVSCNLSVAVCHGKPTGTLNSVTVEVETDRMSKPLPEYIGRHDTEEAGDGS